MGKTVTSPVARFPGTVTIKDPFFLPEAIAWEQATDNADEMLEVEIKKDADGKETEKIKGIRKGFTNSQREGALIEGFRAVIESWNLEGIDPEHFPMSPKADVTNLIMWLLIECRRVYYGVESPNALPPEPGTTQEADAGA